MKKEYKKYILIGIIVLSIILVKLIVKVTLNNSFIKQYEKGLYTSSGLDINSIVNIYEPYIVKYNYGNYFYKNGEYEKAYEKYVSALKHRIPDDRICKVKINTSLSLVMQLESKKTRDEQNALLDKAASYLDDDCNDKAPQEDQKTAEELRQIIEKLRNNQEKKDDGKDDGGGKDDNEDDPLDDKLNQIERDNENAERRRDESLETSRDLDNRSDFCYTDCW
jgi:tetratricopeptide (TPR) repeat protein